ncbi:MAG: acetylglutamate kinase [Bryobacteraceae bacterium]
MKTGGTLLDEPADRDAVARQLAEVSREHELVVVHGGGKQVTRFLEERGTSSRFVQGLRVSDPPVIDAVMKVIAGSVNKELVSAIIAAGESAVGLSGVDGHLTTAVQREPDLGLVGKAANTDARLLDLLVNAGYLPVIACIAGDRNGNIYNVNADEMAVSCSISWRADKLLFLTDVPGVKNAHGQIIGHLAPEQARELVASGVASGGMQAKLAAAKWALEAGVGEVIIAPGLEPAVCMRLLAGERVGTRLSLAFPAEGASA